MAPIRSALVGLILSTPFLLTTRQARAASLQQVNDWAVVGLPSDVSMYAYVPDNVADRPPLLVLIHYCGGTAPAVFGQARGGGIVQAADEYGFIIVVPSSGRCWDIVSDKTRTRNGNGDSHAIRQMVTHAIGAYGANADRVYATGDSSGGMMTELLLALYPDVFKGGSTMAGMPAGCRGANESGNGGGYSGACAGGDVSHTAQEWGDLVRSFYPDYTGPRPRVQMFHGDDDPLIDYNNHSEAIKEWSNVLGLESTPTEDEGGVRLGMHQATRQTWVGECGMPVLEAFTSLGGDHGPSDALFLADHLIPFLGLDDTGPVDPVVVACESQGAGGGDSGGSDNAGGDSPVGDSPVGDGSGALSADGGGRPLNADGSGGVPGADASGSAPNADGSGGAPGAVDSLGSGADAPGALAASPGGVSAAALGDGPSTRAKDDSAQGCSVALPHPDAGGGSRWDWLALLAMSGLLRAARSGRSLGSSVPD